MQAVVLKCPLRAQFHFGKIALDVDTSLDDTSVILHSDTLFSAIIVTAEQVFGKAAEFIQLFENQKIRISSGFHCLEYEPNRYIYFLPKPIHFNIINNAETNDERKKQAKINFISKKVWEKGWGPNDWEKEGCIFLQKEYVMHPSEIPSMEKKQMETLRIYETHALPKVKVHTPKKEGGIYYQANVELAPNGYIVEEKNEKGEIEKKKKWRNCHYYFLLDDENLEQTERNELHTVLRILADSGIGGERSVGCGRLTDIEFHDFNHSIPANNYRFLLSLYNLGEEDKMESLVNWKMITRGGRRVSMSQVHRPEKLKKDQQPKLQRVKMLLEGAIISDDLKGRIVDVSVPEGSNHLRNGMGFSLPIHPNVNP